MSCLAQAPVVPSLGSPVVCVVMMVAIRRPGWRSSRKGSLTLGYYLVKVKFFKKRQ